MFHSLYSASMNFSSQVLIGRTESPSVENNASRFAILLPSHRYRHTLQRNGIGLPKMGVGRASLNPSTNVVLLLVVREPKLK